jgi:putative redox protein
LKACIRHVDGHTFMAKSDSNHWIPLDTGAASGGSASANDPFQLLVIACAGCVSLDVVDIIRKSRKTFTRYELTLEASRAEHPPKILRALHFHAHLDSEDLTEDVIRRALELSLTKYCSVSLSLDRSVKFSARITLNHHRGEEWPIPRHPSLYSE